MAASDQDWALTLRVRRFVSCHLERIAVRQFALSWIGAAARLDEPC
jgi:hypothetical protein